jgi:ubiquinone/menaquinone biosynthesis C-methylase UbiE
MQASDYADLYALEDTLWWFRGMRAITAALLDPFCAPGRDRLVLDAGCGTGANLAWLRRSAGRGRVVGIDLSSSALHFCSDRGEPGVAQASTVELPFAGRVFDLVTSFDVLGQVPGPGDDARALTEIHRVLKPGGHVFVRVAAYEWMRSDHDRALATHRRYTLGELRATVERAGLSVVRATYANGLLLPVAALRRLVLARLRLAAAGSDVKPLPGHLAWLDRALAAALGLEARFLRRPTATLRAGLSAICVAEAPPR